KFGGAWFEIVIRQLIARAAEGVKLSLRVAAEDTDAESSHSCASRLAVIQKMEPEPAGVLGESRDHYAGSINTNCPPVISQIRTNLLRKGDGVLFLLDRVFFGAEFHGQLHIRTG